MDAALERFAAGLPPPERNALTHKQPPVYAAGAEGNPVMLAEIKVMAAAATSCYQGPHMHQEATLLRCKQEVDPSVLRAREDAQAAMAQLTAAALSAGTNPNAVEGYIPRSSRRANAGTSGAPAHHGEPTMSKGAGAEHANNGLSKGAEHVPASTPAQHDGVEQPAMEPTPAPSQPQQPVLVRAALGDGTWPGGEVQ